MSFAGWCRYFCCALSSFLWSCEKFHFLQGYYAFDKFLTIRMIFKMTVVVIHSTWMSLVLYILGRGRLLPVPLCFWWCTISWWLGSRGLWCWHMHGTSPSRLWEHQEITSAARRHTFTWLPGYLPLFCPSYVWQYQRYFKKRAKSFLCHVKLLFTSSKFRQLIFEI